MLILQEAREKMPHRPGLITMFRELCRLDEPKCQSEAFDGLCRSSSATPSSDAVSK